MTNRTIGALLIGMALGALAHDLGVVHGAASAKPVPSIDPGTCRCLQFYEMYGCGVDTRDCPGDTKGPVQ